MKVEAEFRVAMDRIAPRAKGKAYFAALQVKGGAAGKLGQKRV